MSLQLDYTKLVYDRFSNPIELVTGRRLDEYLIAYQTYGRADLSSSRTILVCHALTGDQFVAEPNPITGQPGWWDIMVGPGRPIDTDEYFVVCANVLGGCMGSTGPSSMNPATGDAWRVTFPIVTITDMVEAQARLLTHLGVRKLYAVIGGSMGGMQTLEWVHRYPDRVQSALVIAAGARHTAQNIALGTVARQAIMWDPDWQAGNYENQPERGLELARMISHISYHSERFLQERYGSGLQFENELRSEFQVLDTTQPPDKEGRRRFIDSVVNHRVSGYLYEQGRRFVDRFDANSYLFITTAMDYFDIGRQHGGELWRAFLKCGNTKLAFVSFTSDWLFPPTETTRVCDEVRRATGIQPIHESIPTDNGHDAFLLDSPPLAAFVRGFLSRDIWADAAADWS
jgi:homoserine O-acetyltransferase/O-succinyltransferase